MFHVVDIHMHCIPFFCGFKNGEYTMRSGRYGKIRLKKGVRERSMPPSFVNSNTDPEMLIGYMDWVGVDKAVLLQAPCYGDHNEYIAEVLEKYPDKFIAGFAVIDPREDIEKIIPELIEIGVDVLNPVQPEAVDPVKLKKTYGNDLSFWGTMGGQTTIPFGTPEQVKQEVRERIETVGRGEVC